MNRPPNEQTRFSAFALIGILLLLLGTGIGGCQSTTSTGPNNPMIMSGGVPVNVAPDRSEITAFDTTVTITVELPVSATPVAYLYNITYEVEGAPSSDMWKAALRDMPTQIWSNAADISFKLSKHPGFTEDAKYSAVSILVNANVWNEKGAPADKLTAFKVVPTPKTSP